jgi:type IV pilus assembly protein PilX
MQTLLMPSVPRCPGRRRSQRGAVLLLTLIVLVVLLLGGVALVRSFDTTLLSAGNIAFKRDLVNQGELVVPRVIGPNGVFQSANGALNSVAARGAARKDSNYSAAILPTNAQGVPLALLSDGAFSSIASTGNDIIGPDGVTRVRYVIDRMCNAEGPDSALGPANCILANNDAPQGGTNFQLVTAAEGSADGTLTGALPQQVMYRISVRVDGPRNTQAFLQTTFAL